MAVLIYTMIAASIILIAGGQEQELVLVYAVAVFVSFIAGLLAMARFFHRRGARGSDGHEPARRRCRRLHIGRQPWARLSADRDRERRDCHRRFVLAMGSRGQAQGDRGDRTRSRG
jgi:hypothetical protein